MVTKPSPPTRRFRSRPSSRRRRRIYARNDAQHPGVAVSLLLHRPIGHVAGTATARWKSRSWGVTGSFAGNAIARDGWPADRQHYRVFLSAPGVTNAAEHHVVALPGQDYGAVREFYPEPPADEQEQRSAPLASDPSGAPVTARMYGPFDLDIITMPRIIDWLEVPE